MEQQLATEVQAEKQKIREDILAKRDALDLHDMMEKSSAIKGKLFALKEFQEADRILFYASFKSEVRTMEMLEEALAMGKKIVLPVANFETKQMTLFGVTSSAALVKNNIGVPEPSTEGKQEINIADIRLIISPSIACTPDCKRLGSGAGFFDRFLERSNATKVGLAYDFQMVANVPMEEHDQYLDAIVTETEIYRRKTP